MGQERECTVETGGERLQGKALLETSELIFRGRTRLKIPFKEMTKVEAAGGRLLVEFGGKSAAFDLGDAAAKWAARILNPPTRLDKLGVGSGTRIRWIGPPDAQFAAEAKQIGACTVRASPDITFLHATSKKDLARIPNAAGPLWIVYPKGTKTIREQDVLQAGRAAGLTDIKVASFSATHTALKFVPRK